MADYPLYPLYPSLPQAAQNEAQDLIECFKKRLSEAAEDAISKLHTDIIPYIESDSWTNFRSQIMDGMRNYDNRKIQGEYDFAEIRKEIFEQFRDQIIPDLNADLVKENAELKAHIKMMRERRD